MSTTHSYDAVRGTLMGLQSTSGGTLIQDWSYDYDLVGNMKFRTDNVVGYTENFTYDNLNRLNTVSNATGILQKSYAYDAIGNITNKSDVGSYTYDLNHPHAVATAGGNSYAYDANGNMLTGAGRTLQWISFNKPSGIWTANGYTGFEYDANHNRITKVTPTSNTVYIGKIFEQITIGGLTKDRNHIYAGSKLVASIENNVGGLTNTRYMHGDHLGSISVITDELGAVVERLRFDVFGAPVNLNGTAKAMGSNNTTRGYTGHEMDASTGLINMNARLYDPILGRFISADTVIPGAGNMQNFNRYTYVNNNPLAYTDPSGHFKLSNLWKAAKPFVVIAAAFVFQQYYLIGTLGMGAVTAGAITGGAMGALSGGGVKGALIGAAGGAFFGMVHGMNFADNFGGMLMKGGMHAFGGGAMAAASGGDIGSGMIGGFMNGFLAGQVDGMIPGAEQSDIFARVVASGVIGGVAATAAGGSFSTGFQSAAFARLLNDEAGYKFRGKDAHPEKFTKADAIAEGIDKVVNSPNGKDIWVRSKEDNSVGMYITKKGNVLSELQNSG